MTPLLILREGWVILSRSWAYLPYRLKLPAILDVLPNDDPL